MRGRAGWRPLTVPVVLLVAGLALFTVAQTPSAGATEILTGGDFESWPGPWTPNGSVQQVSTPSVSGQAVALTAPSSIQHQPIACSPGANYQLTAMAAAAQGTGSVALQIAFLSDGFDEVGGTARAVRNASDSFSTVTTSATAPANAAFVRVSLTAQGAGGSVVYIDNVSLTETLAPPTPTPTPSPDSPTDTPAPTATDPAGAGPTATPAQPTHTPTTNPGATATRTRTPTKTPTATKTSTPKKSPTAKSPATPTKQPTPTPAPPTTTGFGGLLLNGDFEAEDEGKPAYWSKFGGTVGLSIAPHGGLLAATLGSTTSSTKWLYQVVPVSAGEWYEIHGFARADGGEAFIRISWYESDDGSGSSTAQVDSDVVTARSWTPLSTGVVQVPGGVASARVRLMLRPGTETVSNVYFDDVEMDQADEPVAVAEPTTSSPLPTAAASPANAATARPITGAPAATGHPSVTFVAAPEDGDQSLRLSEVLSDPTEAGRDSPYEWVELVNVSASAVHTGGWQIGDATSTDVLPDLQVPAGGYVVVAGKAAVFADGIPVLRLDDGEIGSGLNNTGDAVRLIRPDGAEVDAISFGDNADVFDPGPAAPSAGATLGIRLPAGDPDPGNWGVTDHATPGEPNSFASARATPTHPGPSAVAGGAPAAPAGSTVIVERRSNDSSTLLWIVIAALGVIVTGLGAFVLHERIPKLFSKKSE